MPPSQSVLPRFAGPRGVGSALTNGTATFLATWHAVRSLLSDAIGATAQL